MVITVHIDRWDMSKILVDNGRQAEPSKKWVMTRSISRSPTKPLYGFGGKRIEPIRVITLPISFGTPENPRTEYITFDVVDMLYPYIAIFGRGLWNTFEAALHSAYLYLKVPATFGVITVFDSQEEAKNIEHSFAPGHKNMHFLRKVTDQPEQPLPK
jgi:hypothetical protein